MAHCSCDCEHRAGLRGSCSRHPSTAASTHGGGRASLYSIPGWPSSRSTITPVGIRNPASLTRFFASLKEAGSWWMSGCRTHRWSVRRAVVSLVRGQLRILVPGTSHLTALEIYPPLELTAFGWQTTSRDVQSGSAHRGPPASRTSLPPWADCIRGGR